MSSDLKFALIFVFVQPVNYGLNEYNGESCGCGTKNLEYDYRADSPPAGSADDVKYKFDFEVQQPKAQENADGEP